MRIRDRKPGEDGRLKIKKPRGTQTSTSFHLGTAAPDSTGRTELVITGNTASVTTNTRKMEVLTAQFLRNVVSAEGVDRDRDGEEEMGEEEGEVGRTWLCCLC